MRKNRSLWNDLLGRFGLTRSRRQKPAPSRKPRALHVEPLEARQLLSAHPLSAVYVSCNFVDQTNPGATTPSYGDAVTAPAGETAPNLGSGTLTYGVNAFSAIQAGVNNVASGGTVYLLPGTYTESDISLAQPVSVVGPAPTEGTATLVPAIADSHEVDRSDWFGGGTHNAFVIRSSNVALSNLTIDGGAGYGYFCGVETDWTSGQTYDDLSVTGLTVQNVFCLGIDLEGGANAGTGDLISGNIVQNVQGAATVRGITLLDASGQISNNQVSTVVASSETPYSNAAVGIYLDSFDIPGVAVSIDNNTVSGTCGARRNFQLGNEIKKWSNCLSNSG